MKAYYEMIPAVVKWRLTLPASDIRLKKYCESGMRKYGLFYEEANRQIWRNTMLA
jgi:hypothetical protein